MSVTLEDGRWRLAGTAVACLAIGGFLVWKLGVVGRGFGYAVLALGLFNLVRFVRTCLAKPGQIVIDEEAVRLPRGLFAGKDVVLAPDQVDHAYFLRRATPWLVSAPVLVIEVAGEALSFPRDWFASDADQRRIARAINRSLDRLP